MTCSSTQENGRSGLLALQSSLLLKVVPDQGLSSPQSFSQRMEEKFNIIRVEESFNDFKHLANSIVAGGPPPNLDILHIQKHLRDFARDGNWGQIFAAVEMPEEFTEDSIWLKILAAIPVIGFISSTICTITLENKLEAGGTNHRRARLLDITQDYRICSLVRALITVALAVATLAVAALSVSGIIFAAGVIAVGLTIAAWHAYKIAINKQFNDSFKQNNGIFT